MLAWPHPALQVRVHVYSLVPRPPLDPSLLFGGGSGNETSAAILQAERYRGIPWGNPMGESHGMAQRNTTVTVICLKTFGI